MFITRISKGRALREFVLCVLIIPTLVCALWMAVFGGTAIHQMAGGYQAVADTVTNWTPELSLFRMLDGLPLTHIASFVGIVLVIVFFVTSSDSGSLVNDTITAGGKIDAPEQQRVFRCSFEGAGGDRSVAGGGGLTALQAAAISTGFPFAILLLVMCISLYKGLKSES